MRLGCDLSGRAPALLDAATLKLGPSGLQLIARPAQADLLLGEQTRRRLQTLAEALDVTAQASAG